MRIPQFKNGSKAMRENDIPLSLPPVPEMEEYEYKPDTNVLDLDLDLDLVNKDIDTVSTKRLIETLSPVLVLLFVCWQGVRFVHKHNDKIVFMKFLITLYNKCLSRMKHPIF